MFFFDFFQYTTILPAFSYSIVHSPPYIQPSSARYARCPFFVQVGRGTRAQSASLFFFSLKMTRARGCVCPLTHGRSSWAFVDSPHGPQAHRALVGSRGKRHAGFGRQRPFCLCFVVLCGRDHGPVLK
nr:hypothetical protein [Pandoravirus massiliensis]